MRARSASLFVTLLACGSSGSPSTPDGGPQVGSLTVTITGVLSGDASVAVSGPSGFHQSLTATTTLTDLAPGTYTIDAATIRIAGALVDTLETATVSARSVNVAAGGAASSDVAYAAAMPSGRLWSPALAAPSLTGWTDAALASPTTASATVSLEWPDGSAAIYAQDFAFDRAGTLWSTALEPGTGKTNEGSQRLAAWSPTSLTDGATVKPAVVLDTADTGGGVPSLDSPLAIAFDATGDLWVGNCGWITGHATLIAFSPASLAASGAPTPTKLTQVSTCPEGLSFDSAGDLWLVGNSQNAIMRYPAAALADAAPAADVTMHLAKPYDYPTASAFDRSGNLWVAQCGTFIGVTAYTPAQLAAGADVDPAIALTSSSWACPVGIAFDNAGNLWEVDNNSPTGGSLTQVSAAQLVASGAVTTAAPISIGAPDWSWGGIAFYPAPSTLPIH